MKEDSWRTLPRPVLAFAGVMVALGLIARLVPLLDIGGRLLEQWPTEDGYFMLAIARNFSLGHGFSVTGGEMPTNGTQPGTTFIWSLVFSLVGGDRRSGVFGVQLLEVAVALGAALGMYRVGLRALVGHPARQVVSLLAAAVWFASPLVIPHSMNCLETGVYTLVGVWVVVLFVERPLDDAIPWSYPRSLLVGALLGASFWARNDACFLILGACLVYLYNGYHCGAVVVRERFLRTLVFGATSVIVASPWLINNYLSFGHIMPISGRAESLTGKFLSNIDDLPAVVAEYLLMVLPIPQVLQDHPGVVALSALFMLVAAGAVLVIWRQARRPARALIILVGIYAIGLMLFYGLYFGAPWFIARYLFPISPYFFLLTTAVLWRLWHGLGPSVQLPMAGMAAIAVLVLTTGLNYRGYAKGDKHQHFQVVEWVTENVDKKTYVGAIQTGTLGFFHDRTINLDGKVNVDAYEALKEARLGEYVAASDIEVLADWAGITDWYDMPPIRDNFDIILNDEERNLGVLRRRKLIAIDDILPPSPAPANAAAPERAAPVVRDAGSAAVEADAGELPVSPSSSPETP